MNHAEIARRIARRRRIDVALSQAIDSATDRTSRAVLEKQAAINAAALDALLAMRAGKIQQKGANR